MKTKNDENENRKWWKWKQKMMKMKTRNDENENKKWWK